MKSARLRACLGLALVAAGLVGLAVSGDLIAHSARFVTFYGLAGAGFAVLATAAASLPLRGAIVAAVILRLIFLPGLPTLTDDYHRYIWDGRVQASGENPYRYAPSDSRLDDVPYAQRESINHPELRTVYPPLTQATFLGVAKARQAVGLSGAGIRAEVVTFKLLFGAFDLATAAAVWWLATGRRRRQATVLYLLCPAVIVQTWGSAHVEAPAVFFCVLAAALLIRHRDGWAGVALGLAAAFKITPLALLVPALLGGRASPARLLAGFAPAFVIPYLPYLLSGGAFGSLFQSGTEWTGGALIFSLLASVVPNEIARWLALAVFVGGAVWIARRTRGRATTAAAFAWTLSLLLLCLPVVHAWYWLAPLALGLTAGVWLPVGLGVVAPVVEILGSAWPARLSPWRRI